MKYFIFTLTLLTSLTCFAGGRVCVGFYNVENLFDTVPNLLTDDRDFTPSGYYAWNTGRYMRKINNIARVLDDMSLDVVGLSEVENREVLHDLIGGMKTDYAYIHRTSGDRRGIDLALLYKGDKFFPDPDPRNTMLVKMSYGRELLYVRGKLAGHRVDIIVCHLPSNFNSYATRKSAMQSLRHFVDQLQREDPQACPILMGDFNATPSDRVMRETFDIGSCVMDGVSFMYNPFYPLAKAGFGSYVYNDRWSLIDNIFLSPALLGGGGLRYDSSGIFIKEYMLSDGTSLRKGYPLRTFSGNTYLGGFSDHLPVYAYLIF